MLTSYSILLAQSPPPAAPFSITAASFLGDPGNTDRVRGARILSDGTIVLAANIGAANPSGLVPTLLNGATAASSGTILRLSADGRSVLSVTRLAAQVEDLAIDSSDNIYVAAWNDGAFKLNPTASTVLWAKPGRALRIDAGRTSDYAALLITSASDPDSETISVYDPSGTQVGSFAGRHNTLDVCLDSISNTVVSIGWRQANASDGSRRQPVQIAYLRGSSYGGAVKYTAYDWSTDTASNRFINRPQNNMADTRGYRCSIGADNKLYGAFEVAGGNHIFRYSPFDIVTSARIVGGDQWQAFYNTKSEHKTFFARYEPATGAYLLGQQLTARLENGRGNTMRIGSGAITADAEGRVYLGGASAWGLPMPPHPAFRVRAGQTTFTPFPNGYLGGTWFMVLSADFRTRLYTTRLATGGGTHAVDARIINSGAARIVFGGTTTSATETYTLNAVQPSAGGGTQDGWFAVIGSSETLTIPAAASALAANAVSAAQINLAWVDNATNESGYLIERKNGASGVWSEIASVGENSTSYSDSNLSAATTYYYRVRAYNSAGNSDYSNDDDATTQPAAGGGIGLAAVYYDNRNLTGTSINRIDPQINFNWRKGSPASVITADTFSARWTGAVEAVESGNYTFQTYSDDGVRLWVNDQLIINNWTNHAPVFNTSNVVTLVAGQRYNIKLEYYENAGGAVARLSWKRPNQSSFEVIPQTQLFSEVAAAVPGSQ